MTDVSKIKALATAISSSSPAIRRYALAQAGITVSAESDIAKLWKEVEMLKAYGAGRNPADPGGVDPTPPSGVDPPPPVNPTFGTLLPARLPVSGGSVIDVNSLSALTTQINSAPTGSTIRITANINGGGVIYNITRAAAAAGPITITQAPGVVLSNFDQWYISGSYLRFKNLYLAGFASSGIFGRAGLKFAGGGMNEADGCNIYDSLSQGILVSEPATDIQIWNCILHGNGTAANTNLDHNIYYSYARGNSVVANCLSYLPSAYALQVYPDSPGVIVTCCTFDDGEIHAPWTRGGMIIGDTSGRVDNCKVVGLISTNAPGGPGMNSYGSGNTGNQLYDSVFFGNSGGDTALDAGWSNIRSLHADPLYVNRTARNYQLQAGSPAIGYIDPARYGYVPPLDIRGIPRVTADAGCYAA